MPRLLNALRDELITAGLVRKPRVAGAAPPMWLGALSTPAAGEGNNPVEVGDTLVFMDGGVVVEAGDPKQVLTDPQHERTRSFLSKVL